MAETSYSVGSISNDLKHGTRLTLLDYVFPRVADGVPPPIGDGGSHVLLNFYATLAQARTDYPFLTSTWRGVSWSAVELAAVALQAGISDPKCSSLFVPRGVYQINVYIDIANRYLGGFQLSGSRWISNASTLSTVFIANNGGTLFDLSGSEYIRFEDFSIQPGISNPSTIGILMARTTDHSPAFQSQGNELVNIYINMKHDAAMNGGMGSIGIYNFASELAKRGPVYINADNAIIETIVNPSPWYARIGSAASEFWAQSPNPNVHVGGTLSPLVRSFGSLGNVTWDGVTLTSSMNACLAIYGPEKYVLANAFLRNNGGDPWCPAVNIIGGGTNLWLQGTCEVFDLVCLTRAISLNVMIDLTRSHSTVGIPSIFFDNTGAVSPGFNGCNITSISSPLTNVDLLAGDPAILFGTANLTIQQGINLTTASYGRLDIFTASGKPSLSLSSLPYTVHGLRTIETTDVVPGVQWAGLTQNGFVILGNDLMVADASNTSPIKITVKGTSHGLVNGQQATLFGISGNGAANGAGFYVKTTGGLGATEFQLYSDAGLATPVAGTGDYVSGGTVRASGRQSLQFFSDGGAITWYLGNSFSGNFQIVDSVNARAILDVLGTALNLGFTGATNTLIGTRNTLQGTVRHSAAIGGGTRYFQVDNNGDVSFLDAAALKAAIGITMADVSGLVAALAAKKGSGDPITGTANLTTGAVTGTIT